jgi:hypothetical protein
LRQSHAFVGQGSSRVRTYYRRGSSSSSFMLHVLGKIWLVFSIRWSVICEQDTQALVKSCSWCFWLCSVNSVDIPCPDGFHFMASRVDG